MYKIGKLGKIFKFVLIFNNSISRVSAKNIVNNNSNIHIFFFQFDLLRVRVPHPISEAYNAFYCAWQPYSNLNLVTIISATSNVVNFVKFCNLEHFIVALF